MRNIIISILMMSLNTNTYIPISNNLEGKIYRKDFKIKTWDEEIKELQQKNMDEDIKKQLLELNRALKENKEKELKKQKLNKKEVIFTLTFYTTLPEENGGYTTTCSGKPLKYGIVASNVYKQGTKINLDKYGTFIVSDRGGSDFNHYNRLDVLIERRGGESNYEYKKRVNNMGRPKVKGYVYN